MMHQSCDGKHGHLTKAAAEKSLKRDTPGGMRVYRCADCNLWHVAHGAPKSATAIRKRKIMRMEGEL